MEQDKIAAFDTLYTNNHIQILKLALPLMPKDKQYFGAVFIKYLELKHTLSFGQKLMREGAFGCDSENYSIDCFFQDIMNYCSKEESETILKMKNMMSTFSTMKEMMVMMELMKQSQEDESEDGETAGGLGGLPMDLLKGMLSEDQIGMFEMFMDNT